MSTLAIERGCVVLNALIRTKKQYFRSLFPDSSRILSSHLVQAQQNLGLLLTLLGVAFGITNILLFRCEMCRSPY